MDWSEGGSMTRVRMRTILIRAMEPYIQYALYSKDFSNPYEKDDRRYNWFKNELHKQAQSRQQFDDMVQDMGGDEGWTKRVWSKPSKPEFMGRLYRHDISVCFGVSMCRL